MILLLKFIEQIKHFRNKLSVNQTACCSERGLCIMFSRSLLEFSFFISFMGSWSYFRGLGEILGICPRGGGTCANMSVACNGAAVLSIFKFKCYLPII